MSVTDFGATDTASGQSAGSDYTDATGVQDQPAEAGQQTQPTERTFRQADVDRIVQERIARERQRYERQAQQPQPAPQAPANFDAIAPVLAQVQDLALESKIGKLGRQYPEFAQNEQEILQHALDLVQDNPAWASHPKLLEQAYRSWKFDKTQSIDVDAIKKQAGEEAVKAYLAKKGGQAATLPTPEGKGGGTPTTASPKVNWKNADQIAKDILAKNKQHQG